MIVTNPFTSTETHPSQSVVVEAQDAGNIIDTSFNETVNLSTGSPAGRFSADRIIWQDTDAITLAQGRAVFYYKDGSSCISEGVSITVSRDGLTPATQAETIQFSVPSGPGSYITINQARMSADGASACTVMITVNDTFGFPVAGMQVTIMTGRGEPADTIFQPVSLTDAEGLCAGSIVSENAGIDTITALCEGQVITMGVNLDSAEGIWHFDSSLEDYSGRGYTGTNSGGLWVTDGLSGSAIRYDGVSSYMQCDSSTILNTTITVEAWVKVFNYPSNCAQILGKFPGPWMFTLWSDGTAAAEVEGRVNYLLFADAGITPLPLDSWNHLVSVYVQNGDFKTYLNGSEVQASSPINPLGDDGSIMLRASNNYPPDVEGGALDGIVDEVRIYGRALSADEITALYNKECRIEFIAVKKIVFTSPEFSMTQNNPSPAILLEAQDRNGSRIASCFDTIVLGSSSPGGRFSVSSTSWADTTSVYFYEGAAVVYYIDANAGFFLLTASGEGFFEDTQVNEILVPGPNAFTSSLAFDAKRARATGSDSITAVVSIKDTFGYPVAGISVTLASARANSDVISPGFAQTTDLNGQCTFAVSSIYCGPDLLSATADGCTVSGSLLLNNSFEDGSVWPDAWTRSVPDSNYKWDNAVFRSGRMSAKVENAQLTETWTNWEQVVEVEPGAVYFLSGWLKTGTLATGAQAAFFIHHLDLNGNIMSQEWTSFVTTSNQAWQEYSLSPSVEGGCVKFRIGCSVYQPTQAGSTAWFDDVRLTGGSNIRFTASRLRIISDAFSVTKNNPSPDVIVQAGDEVGNIDTDYNNTVSLSSDSENGRFSIDRLQWSASSDSSITLSSGTATFFYKDSLAGNPELSAMSYQLSADSQSESILEPAVVETNSFIMYGSYRIGASATNKCSVIVVTNDTFGYPVGGIEVTLASARADSDVISPGPAQTTDVNGQATWTFGSIYTGDDTLSVIAEGGKLIEQGVRKDISGFWKFEEGAGLRAMDMSGRSNNASLVNDPAWAPGRLNSCLDYETNDYAAVPDAESINPGTGSITVEAWVKTTQAPAPLEGDKIIARKDTTGDPRVFWGLGMIGYDTSTLGRANFQVYKSGIGNNQVLSTGTINDGQWHLLTGIRDIAAGKIKLYVDGIFQNTGDEAFGDLTGAEPLCFGNDASFFGPASSFQGLIDEVRLYKSALAETEVIASFLGKCVVTFVPGAAGLKFISSPFTAVAGTASTPAMLEAQDPAGERVEDFSETCDLLSSAANGRFSPDGINWSTSNNTFILFSSGTGVFYYMDADTGMPVITAYRISLIADTQTENIIPPPSPSNTASFMLINSYLVPGDGASACTVVVCVLSDSGIPIPGETVTLSASRSNSTTIQPTNQPTDSNGQATFTLKSNYPGQETITASCSAEGTITRAVQRSDAAAIWGFDELGTAFTDISGNMHNGSLSGAVHSQGKFGTGLKFDGANDYATVPDSPDLRITGNITVEAWIYMDAFADTADWHNEIISKTDFNVMRFFVRQSNHRLCVSQVYGGVSGVDDGNQALSAGQWYHVAFTYDGQKFFIYVNGEQDAEFSHSGTLLTSMNPVLIGKQIDTSLFRGLIDELRIYTRALSPEEIRASYRSIANVIFTGVPERVKITSAPFSVARNNPSPEIILEIRDTTGNKYPVFNETVALASSSLTGRFSTDGLQWNTANNTSIWLSAGSGMFYYKDSVAGAPILSASRIGLSADSQSESILEPSVLETNCFIAYSAFRISADGLAACTVTVNVNDTFGSPIDGVLVTISSSRGNSDTIQPTNQLTDSNGQATWTLRSVYDGVTILTAQAQGRTISRGVRKGISGLWKFEDGSGLTAKDQSGRSNNGKLLNGPSWAFGRFNNCLQYDGTNDIVAVPNADSLNPDTGSLTVEAWVKTSQAPVPLEGDKVIARKDTTGAPRIFWGFVMGGFDTGTIGKAMFQVYNSSSGVVGITSGNTINNGAWHHLAGIRDVSAGQIRFFLDGVSQGSSNEGLGNITNSESLSFGNDASWFGPGSAFQGLIDEVKVYQAALTDSEVIASFLGNCPVMFLPAATKVEIVFPSSFSIPANAISAGINIEARNSYGMKDENFGGTCGLSSSSADGRFSADRLQWSATNETYITLSAGAGSFYYKDSSVGNVTLSAFS
ncbi:hypothetical protein AUJ67_02645 [Candidatus Desantisbacteria bacterium CG1_02_49_89]|nr:MAG: hypothetical protein AUJ67_02645 [Candidatus Desantisbacteria bacterium CG1_02_49_89]